jgi:hypothetical protein
MEDNYIEKRMKKMTNPDGTVSIGKLAVTRTSPELRGRIEKYLKDREERGSPIKVVKP